MTEHEKVAVKDFDVVLRGGLRRLSGREEIDAVGPAVSDASRLANAMIAGTLRRRRHGPDADDEEQAE